MEHQRIAMKVTKSLEGRMYTGCLRSLAWFYSDMRRLRGGLTATCSSSQGAKGQVLICALWWQQQDAREWHRAALGVRNRFFTRSWSPTGRGSPGRGHGPKLLEYKEHLDNAHRHRVWTVGGGWSCVAPQVWWPLWVPSNSGCPVILRTSKSLEKRAWSLCVSFLRS